MARMPAAQIVAPRSPVTGVSGSNPYPQLRPQSKTARAPCLRFRCPKNNSGPLAEFVHSLNATAFESKPAGSAASGEKFFFGPGNCASCHTVHGRGASVGPDLSSVARQLHPAGTRTITHRSRRPHSRWLHRCRRHPPKRKIPPWLRRNRGSHDLQLQTLDGVMHFLNDQDYEKITAETASLMPASPANPDLIAWLATLGGPAPGPISSPVAAPSASEFEALLHPNPGDWPTYYGALNGNRFSALTQVNTRNAAQLQLQWIYPIPYQPLETTPLIAGGMMFVTGPNQVSALDGRSGREIWKFTRPRTPSGVIAGDASLGAQRGVALLGDRVFFNTDDSHMLCLNRLTGALQWDVPMTEAPMHYGSTGAPLVVNDLVISGVAGGDEGIRGFIGAWKVTTGELVWRFYTVDKQDGGGSTWLTGTYDPETGLLYWPTGNPFPDTDGSSRPGDNLYTDCDLALDPKTGQLKWYFQYTPHDLHDWDAQQPPVLVNAQYRGQDRKLLLHGNRNGFFYVLDRTNGKFLFAAPLVKKLTWASGIDANGRPILTPNNETGQGTTITCPAVRGATNWYSPAFSPRTNFFYVMTVEDCGSYRAAKQGGFGFLNNPKDPSLKYLRALDIETGKVAWEIQQIGPAERNYSGVLATAGDLVFYGETSGGFAAVDATTGATLWHFDAGNTWKGSPMTYTIDGRQYIAVANGANILSFALPVTRQQP